LPPSPPASWPRCPTCCPPPPADAEAGRPSPLRHRAVPPQASFPGPRRAEITAHALVAGISALLVLAAWRDVATRLIPDLIPLAIVLLALGLRAPAGWGALLASAGIAVALFLALLALAMRGLLGGGDVKLAAAVALALPPGAAWDFIQATVFCGGALGVGYIAASRLLPGPARAASPHTPSPQTTAPQTTAPQTTAPHTTPLRRIARAEARRLRRGGPLPYAVAIAGGGILALVSLGG